MRPAMTSGAGLAAAMVVATLAVSAVTGCFNAGLTPRTGDVLGPGEVGGGASFTLFAFAPGEVGLADGDSASGNTAQRGKPHALAYLAPHVMNTQAWLNVGVVERLQLGVSAGMQQLGGELRVALADEDENEPVSAALGVAGMWRPFADLGGPWLGLTLDVSRRFGQTALFVNHGLSFGPEEHAVGLAPRQERQCGSFGEEGCGEYSAPRQFRVTRRELRASFAVGAAFRVPDTGGTWVVSAVPYVTVWSAEEMALECFGCSYLEPVAFEEGWGVHFVLGYHFSGW
jgi:hypothetical protein